MITVLKNTRSQDADIYFFHIHIS